MRDFNMTQEQKMEMKRHLKFKLNFNSVRFTQGPVLFEQDDIDRSNSSPLHHPTFLWRESWGVFKQAFSTQYSEYCGERYQVFQGGGMHLGGLKFRVLCRMNPKQSCLTAVTKEKIAIFNLVPIDASQVFPEMEILATLPSYLRIPAVLYSYRAALPRLPLLCKIEMEYPGFLAVVVRTLSLPSLDWLARPIHRLNETRHSLQVNTLY